MTKIVNSWTEFQPLKRVIVGRPEGTQVFAPEPGSQLDEPSGGFPLGTWGKFPQELVDAANEAAGASGLPPTTARPSSSVSPHGNLNPAGPRPAFSHSRAVGSRFPAAEQKSFAS